MATITNTPNVKNARPKKITKFEQFTGDILPVKFDATVLRVIHEGVESEKRPIVLELKLEQTGENFKAVSWNYTIVEKLKAMVSTTEVACFEGQTGTFKNQNQIKIGILKEIYTTLSVQKKIIADSTRDLQAEFKEFIDANIHDKFCLKILDDLIIKNNKFFKWPAAKKIHHNYSGGLALHSLNVAKKVLADSEVYKENKECFNIDVALTGALIHDIGKTLSYTETGGISFEGQFATHITLGSNILSKWLYQNPTKDQYEFQKYTILNHIILSHHGTFDMGSPITPKTIEAVMVHYADHEDATVDALTQAYVNMAEGTMSEGQKVLNGGSLYRWKQQH